MDGLWVVGRGLWVVSFGFEDPIGKHFTLELLTHILNVLARGFKLRTSSFGLIRPKAHDRDKARCNINRGF